MKRAGIGQWNLTSPTSFRQYYQSLLGKDDRNKTTFQDPGQARSVLLAGPRGFKGGTPNPLPARPQSQRNDDRIQAASQAFQKTQLRMDSGYLQIYSSTVFIVWYFNYKGISRVNGDSKVTWFDCCNTLHLEHFKRSPQRQVQSPNGEI